MSYYLVSCWRTPSQSRTYLHAVYNNFKMAILSWPIFKLKSLCWRAELIGPDSGAAVKGHLLGKGGWTDIYQSFNMGSFPPWPAPPISKEPWESMVAGRSFGPEGNFYIICWNVKFLLVSRQKMTDTHDEKTVSKSWELATSNLIGKEKNPHL